VNDIAQRTMPMPAPGSKGARRKPRVLISTISPVSGGVPTMTAFIVRTLRGRGFEPVLVHYQPYSVSPTMSVLAIRLLGGRLGRATGTTLEGCETHAIGAWLPEFEVTHYLATSHWRELIDSAQAWVVVSGNALSALPFYQSGRNFVAWLASGWNADRVDRVRQFSTARMLFDRTLVSPAARRLERAILGRGVVLSLSEYTRRTLDGIVGRSVVRDVLPMPIDTDFFSPDPVQRVRGRIGFSGRLDDPRKNIALLLEALSRLQYAGHEICALLVGGEPGPAMMAQLQSLGIERAV
jgi:glycosyltransferase involved in cell wall biosynthesis